MNTDDFRRTFEDKKSAALAEADRLIKNREERLKARQVILPPLSSSPCRVICMSCGGEWSFDHHCKEDHGTETAH